MEFICALVNTIAGLNEAFKEVVDDYLETCLSQNVAPEKLCKGSFNDRIGHELHLSAMIAAPQQQISLNDVEKQQIAKGVK